MHLSVAPLKWIFHACKKATFNTSSTCSLSLCICQMHACAHTWAHAHKRTYIHTHTHKHGGWWCVCMCVPCINYIVGNRDSPPITETTVLRVSVCQLWLSRGMMWEQHLRMWQLTKTEQYDTWYMVHTVPGNCSYMFKCTPINQT